ncbi:general transcription factor II-I repeat domain-containing protein 2B-like [Nylanderia fulva]|uniref:general transcription factor II-I repeat domain-containing protein 2B-like n=1 Tax=Nylanderia fulva TaxID=613905 RepID=UPI0010FB00BC|nr:general transcription factor II-I repeat domain-containing protein 2B-like [Nylanderia fulva]
MDHKRYVQEFDQSWEVNYFFGYISDRTVCLLCGFEPSVVKKFAIERHFRNRHAVDYSNYSHSEKLSVIEGLKSCTYFSLCLDESTDIRHMSQLSIFIRIVQDDFSYVEELLDFVSLHDTTTGLDIFLAVDDSLKKFDIDFSKCSSVTTDGAKAMTGSKIGFAGQLKQRNINIPIIHCIIHQEALSGKVIKLSTAMETVTKIINIIKGGQNFLSHRKFQSFLHEHNAIHTDVPLHCPVRWLSAAKCLEIFFSIRKEILLFIQEKNNPKFQEYISLLENITFLSELAFITDMTNQLRLLNLKLQKPTQNISQLVSHVDSFRSKLQLFKSDLNNNIFHYFPSCQILFEEHGSSCNFKENIHFVDSVIEEFDTRFTCFEKLRTELILFENPLTAPIAEQQINLRDELCDLQNDISLKTVQETGAEFYNVLSKSTYPKLRDFGLRIYSMFGSTYLCETSFSKMKFIKNEKRSCLSDNSLPRLMRLATCNMQIDVPAVACKKARKS